MNITSWNNSRGSRNGWGWRVMEKINWLRERAASLKMPEVTRKVFEVDLAKLQGLEPAASEANVTGLIHHLWCNFLLTLIFSRSLGIVIHPKVVQSHMLKSYWTKITTDLQILNHLYSNSSLSVNYEVPFKEDNLSRWTVTWCSYITNDGGDDSRQ